MTKQAKLKQRRKGFDHKPESRSWKLKGAYKGNKTYAQYQQYKRSLNRDNQAPNSDDLMQQFLANGGTITKCPDKIA